MGKGWGRDGEGMGKGWGRDGKGMGKGWGRDGGREGKGRGKGVKGKKWEGKVCLRCEKGTETERGWGH